MRVLLSAYACEPGKGSEPGVGWNWLRRISGHHDVVVMTRANNARLIELEPPLDNVRFVYLDLPRWLMWWKRGPRGARLYAILWQVLARRAGRRLVADEHFDLVHHLTWATHWMPAGVASLGPPFVFGPVGGGTPTPWVLWPEFGLRGLLYETARFASQQLAKLNPMSRRTWAAAAVILVQNRGTLEALPAQHRGKALIAQNAGIDPSEIIPRRAGPSGPAIKAVFVGRASAWKGLSLAIRVVACDPDGRIELDVVGDGPDLPRCRRLALRLGVAHLVHFHGWVTRAEVLDRLEHAEVLLFPSQHDEGPLGVVEAMAQGVRPVVLDHGGPAISVSADAGCRVPITKRATLVRALHAATLDAAAMEPDGPLRRAAAFTWPAKDAIIAAAYSAATAAAGGPA